MALKQTQWSRDFNERAYDRLAITIPKGRKEDVRKAAERAGLSVNNLVNRLLMQSCGLSEQEWKAKDQETV